MQQIKDKKIKDPLYGYITIPQDYIKNVIDTPIFQRLRRVLQTSYSPLYASTLHNRFVHSMGVYHLGEMVAKRFKSTIIKKNYLQEELAEKYANVYRLACLLHDVGHAPFSHTGEFYYKDENYSSGKLHERLCELVDSDEFKKDLPPEADCAAPHEIMSAIIGIKEFGDMIGDGESRELFARCVTGYKYDKTMPKGKTAPEKDIKNCFIGMLNSKVIDVDRLDYLIRDAYTSGFETVNIDYIRLLKAITIVIEDGHYVTAYKKDAVSIIENVVYAHDAERKWIQNHPVVLYETYILSHILENLKEKLDSDGKKLFSEASLSLEGQVLRENTKVSLMCDDDIVYLLKNRFSDELSREFFDRSSRMHPLWKSEAEYKAYISTQGKEVSFLDIVTSWCNLEKKHNLEYAIVDTQLMRSIETELEKIEEEKSPDPLAAELNRKKIENSKSQLKMCSFLLRQAEKYSWGSSLLFIKTTMFNSNFKKEDVKNIPIVFGKEGSTQIKKLKEVCSLLDAEKVERDLCYLFYRRNEETKNEISVVKFCEDLLKTIEE